MNKRILIIEYARNAIGCAYDKRPSSGVEGESYNCSFLTFCAYKYAGLEIPKWQGHQNGDGSQSDWVRWAGNWKWNAIDLEPGDLCFYGSSPYNTYHVGIYVGDGVQIDSMPGDGVQERFVYETFCGGGWPFEVEPERKEVNDMQALLSVRDIIAYFDGTTIHDVTDPQCIEPLDKISNASIGKPLPRIKLTDEEYARVCQVLRAGMPVSLYDLMTKNEPRS